MVTLTYQPSTVSPVFVCSVHVPFLFFHCASVILLPFGPRYISAQLAQTHEILMAMHYGILM